ncbi:hypothetical protein N7453_001211 [Penicillium expansum]|nr:hypothetical protein N7453_001211 [Penicillium expansum]
MSVENSEPELLLAMAALGAQYRHENRKSIVLFYAAKDIFEYKARKTNMTSMDMSYPSGSNSQACSFSHSEPNTDYSSGKITRLINEARCALHLIAFATWQSERNIVREAFSLQSFLATCVRECGLQELNSNTAMDWHSWIQNESQRRVKFFSFVILNLHSIAFNSPPILLSDEINLRLPCTCIEWIAPNPTKWSIFRGTNHQEQMHLQDALLYVTRHPQDPHGLPSQPIPSPLANYIILHALLQRISLTYQAFGSYNTNNHTLLNSQKDSICNALRAWTGFWQRTPESSLDPRNPNGPVPFTSAALLGLAYVRLAFDIGSYRIASCQDAKQVADRFLKLPLPSPSPYLLPAILHATHALSIPIKLGIKFIAKSHAFVWSVQHSLCGLEFAICTNKWLSYLSDCQKTRSLSEHENRLVGWIDEIVEEGRTSSDDELWSRPSPSSNTAYLAFAVVKLWALLIKRNAQWPILKIIGDGLELYASSCETQGLESSWR